MCLASNKGYHPELSTVLTMSKPVPSQLEFSKLTGADDSFCLGLTSSAYHYFV